MSSSSVGRRYAVALFQIAKEQNLLEQMENELRVIKEVFENNKELVVVLKSPRISKKQKKEILTNTFSSVNQYVLNTLMLLSDRHREDYIPEVADQFLKLIDEEKGVAEADVYTVRPLTDAEKDALSSAYAPKVGKKSLRINNIVDKDLLGGVKIRIGNCILDGSLRGKLDRLERELLG